MRTLIILGFVCFVLQSCGKKPEADFTWSPKNPKAGEEVQFTNLSINAKSYSWNLGDMNISSDKNPKHTYEDAGQYIIDLFASKGLRSDEKTVTITVGQ
ncbi:MAG: PKD domain-containing protein [Saprospiraceae bacterium]|nr:PKD domain-containing protein [Saprospiraceae bacterium]